MNRSESMHPIKWLWKWIRPHRGIMALALLCAVIQAGLVLYTPLLIGRGVDQVAGAGEVNFAALWHILLILLAVILGGTLFHWLTTLCTNKMTYEVIRAMRLQAFHRLLRYPLRFIDGTPHGQLLDRVVNGVDTVGEGLIQGISQALNGSLTILGTIGLMLSLSVPITLVVVALTPLSLVLGALIARGTHQTFLKQNQIQAEMSGFVTESFIGQKTVKLFGVEENMESRLEEINQRLYHWGFRAQIYPAFTNPLTRFVNGMVFAAVGVIGAVTAIYGHLTPGQLSSFLAFANQYTKPFNEVAGVMAQFQTAIAAVKWLQTLMDEPMEEEVEEQLPVSEGDQVVFRQVAFRYVPDRPLIEDFSLTVQPGQRVAIVGPTGSGKTTLINLLMRFYDVDAGEITVGGRDIRTISRDSLRERFGMVLQETWLTRATVAENIAYGQPDATMEEIQQAAMAAHAHGFIMQLPQGYDTMLGNQGSLSEGQRQLICIARVILMNPAMLILDEATSNIDTRTEMQVQSAFQQLMHGKTTFVVAHRLSTIQSSDVILVMRDGHIVEQGNHETLMEKGGFYAALHQSQFQQTSA